MIEKHSDHMAGVSSEGFALRPFRVRVPVQVDESPVVSSGNRVLSMVSVNSVDMVSAGVWRENPLHPPPDLDSVSGPLFVLELCSSALDLTHFFYVKEQQFVGPAVRLNVLSVPGPIHVRNEGLMSMEFSLQLVRVAIDIENVDVVVMGTHCQHGFIR